ncbi:MAG TPA: MFS transporter [Chloroflexia bacterium]|nr:MFS transporter [Chloroflexia bacterium]
MDPTSAPAPPRALRFAGGSRNLLALSLVSLLTDLSSEMIAPVRIFFLVGVLGTPLPLAGLIEGILLGGGSLVRLATDRLPAGWRRGLPALLGGYALSQAAKPLLALAGGPLAALGLVSLDRLGRALRTPPRDALLAQSVAPVERPAAFALHRVLDTAGATAGPFLALLLLNWSRDDVRQVITATAVPGLLIVLILLAFVRGRRASTQPAAGAEAAPAATPAGLGSRFWMLTGAGMIFGLGSLSEAFFLLQGLWLTRSLQSVVAAYAAYRLVYALLVAPLSGYSQRSGRIPALIVGYGGYALILVGWGFATLAWHVWALFILYGVFAALTEGAGRALAAELAPPGTRPRALAWFGGLTGLAVLPANVIAAWLWSSYGPAATFGYAAWLGAAACALLLVWGPWITGRRPYHEPEPAPPVADPAVNRPAS